MGRGAQNTEPNVLYGQPVSRASQPKLLEVNTEEIDAIDGGVKALIAILNLDQRRSRSGESFPALVIGAELSACGYPMPQDLPDSLAEISDLGYLFEISNDKKLRWALTPEGKEIAEKLRWAYS